MTDAADSAGPGEEPAVFEALRSAVDEQASASDLVERVETPEGVEYLVRGAMVALVGDRSLAFLVGEPVASAAARTPDAVLSTRGSGWVELRPTALDRFTLDRAAAWFDLAVKRAAEAPRTH